MIISRDRLVAALLELEALDEAGPSLYALVGEPHHGSLTAVDAIALPLPLTDSLTAALGAFVNGLNPKDPPLRQPGFIATALLVDTRHTEVPGVAGKDVRAVVTVDTTARYLLAGRGFLPDGSEDIIKISGGRYHDRRELPDAMKNIIAAALTFITSVLVHTLPPSGFDRHALLALMRKYVQDMESMTAQAKAELAALNAQMN